MFNHQQLRLLASLLVSLLAIGCGSSGPPRAAVQGNVTWEGESIETGTINFIPTGDGPAATGSIQNGEYSLPKGSGPVIGECRVEIFAMKDFGLQEAGPPHPPGTKIEVVKQIIPTEYNNSSELTVSINDGDNSHDFMLPLK